MESERVVGERINVHTYFGRCVETPSLVSDFQNVKVGSELCKVGTQFHSDVRLAHAVTETIPCCGTERQLEYGVLLVGSDSGCFVYRECLTGDILVIRMVIQE